ncbi:hypothetical protein [Dickeya poaceiphila]|nr:hypothetical protein [Dickeya poaceiphila]
MLLLLLQVLEREPQLVLGLELVQALLRLAPVLLVLRQSAV